MKLHRHALAAIAMFAFAAPASAQQAAPSRPQSPAPAASAAFAERADWCTQFAAWYVAVTPMQGARPEDVRPTHLVETEINYCELDPQAYERQTLAELDDATRDT